MIDTKNFQPGAAPLTLVVTNTAAVNGTFTQSLNTPLNSTPLMDARIVNQGAITAFFQWGGTNGSVTATTTSGQPLLGNMERTFNMGIPAQVFSAILGATGTSTCFITPGNGA